MDVVDRLWRDRPLFHSKGTKRWDSLPGTLRAIRADHVGAGDFRAQISKMIAMKMQVSAADVLMLKNVKLAGLQSGDFQHGSPLSGV
jgi:hypothetical protein